MIAAPVGVTISPVWVAPPGAGTVGAFARAIRADVAGAGTGRTPCSLLMTPEPVGNGDEYSLSIPSESRPTMPPTTSTSVSSVPNSCRCTPSMGVLCTRASASSRRRNTAVARPITVSERPLPSTVSTNSWMLRGRLACSSRCTSTSLPFRPARCAFWQVMETPFTFMESIAEMITSNGAPASTVAPRIMSPLAPPMH